MVPSKLLGLDFVAGFCGRMDSRSRSWSSNPSSAILLIIIAVGVCIVGVGGRVGMGVGVAMGEAMGLSDGFIVGMYVGVFIGIKEGLEEGPPEGTVVGD
eukprot:CAMPEP_0171357748 /NCGR_PEP_ID=MMETSP0878-20121228/46400_1 /TAXON_ID=67004 /ORGANISM="Thalassiosira weissflogii, Strain CCMP1336" /LENGTH=98 /DNA_ID=CAMNT_0011863797 /DNA_START=426 /DNA_END=722 /DNA_ORIENTATION=-